MYLSFGASRTLLVSCSTDWVKIVYMLLCARQLTHSYIHKHGTHTNTHTLSCPFYLCQSSGCTCWSVGRWLGMAATELGLPVGQGNTYILLTYNINNQRAQTLFWYETGHALFLGLGGRRWWIPHLALCIM